MIPGMVAEGGVSLASSLSLSPACTMVDGSERRSAGEAARARGLSSGGEIVTIGMRGGLRDFSRDALLALRFLEETGDEDCGLLVDPVTSRPSIGTTGPSLFSLGAFRPL